MTSHLTILIAFNIFSSQLVRLRGKHFYERFRELQTLNLRFLTLYFGTLVNLMTKMRTFDLRQLMTKGISFLENSHFGEHINVFFQESKHFWGLLSFQVGLCIRAVAALRLLVRKKAEKARRRHLFSRSPFHLLAKIHLVTRHQRQSPKIHTFISHSQCYRG